MNLTMEGVSWWWCEGKEMVARLRPHQRYHDDDTSKGNVTY